MKIKLVRVDGAFRFLAANEAGHTVHLDASPQAGGEGAGARPMELLVMGLGGCSGIDILSILKKGRQEVEAFGVELEAERAEGKVPSLFTRIHAHYVLEGDLEPDPVRRAIELSLGKYCSVAKILEKTARITYSFAINGTHYE